MILFIQDFFWPVHKFHKLLLTNYKQGEKCLCSVLKNWTGASEQQTAVLGICKRLILKVAQNGSSSKPTRRTLSPVGTFRVDPKWVISESGKGSRCLLLSRSLGHLQENRKHRSSFLPFPLPHIVSPFHGNLPKSILIIIDKVVCPDSCQESKSHTSAKPTLQTGCWGVTISKLLKTGSSAACGRNSCCPQGTPDPGTGAPSCCRTCCSSAQQLRLLLGSWDSSAVAGQAVPCVCCLPT